MIHSGCDGTRRTDRDLDEACRGSGKENNYGVTLFSVAICIEINEDFLWTT